MPPATSHFSILFADALTTLDLGWLIPVVTAATVLASVIGKGALDFFTARHKIQQEQRADALHDYQTIVDRMEKQVQRHEIQVAEQQKVINRMQELHADCRRNEAELRTWCLMLHDGWKRLVSRVANAGIPVDPVMDLPDAVRHDADSEKDTAEFLKRTTAGNMRLGEAVDDRILEGKPPAVPPPGG